jgi:hypothetical protein
LERRAPLHVLPMDVAIDGFVMRHSLLSVWSVYVCLPVCLNNKHQPALFELHNIYTDFFLQIVIATN